MEPCGCLLPGRAELHLQLAVPREHIKEGTCTSLVPAWLSWAPLLQHSRLVLTQCLAATSSTGSPGRALPD